MLSRILSRTINARQMQTRMSSGFNKFPVLKVTPVGLSGNVCAAVGVISVIITTWFVQNSGYLIPKTPGMGIRSPQGRLPMDLTPDELKKH